MNLTSNLKNNGNMKTKIFTFFIALMTSFEIVSADTVIQVEKVYFRLNENDMTANVTYRNYQSYYQLYNTGWNIDSVNIPSSVEYNSQVYSVTGIGEHAFEDCTNLSYVSIPLSVTNIGYNAFRNCLSLSTIEIPENVISVHLTAFVGCSSLTSVIWNAKNCADYSLYTYASDSIYPFPSSIISFEFGENVEKIPTYLCYHQQNLTHVSLPHSVKSIGERAFSMSGLVTIDMPDSLKTIGKYAFLGCHNLIAITIPQNVTNIEEEVLSNCNSLASVTWNARRCVVKQKSSLYTQPTITSLIFGDSVECIPSNLYCNTNLDSITIPKNVTKIESGFGGSNLRKVVWLAISVADRDRVGFFSNRYITEFIIGDEVMRIPSYLCYGMSQLTSIAIPQSVISIGQNAFKDCTGLTSISIPQNVKHIEQNAFAGCTELTKVETKNLSAWSSIMFGNEYANPLYYAHHLFLNNCELTDFVIPDSVNQIGDYAFINGTSLISVSIPNHVNYLGKGAFYGCSNLISVNIPDSVSAIESSAFCKCSSMPSINIHNSITSIGSGAFGECKNITSIDIPNSVTQIGGGAFSECSALTTVFLPDSLTLLGMAAFYNCTSLKNIRMPRHLATIDQNTFKNDSSLVSIDLPNNLEKISVGAFYGCANLTSVTIPSKVICIYHSAFSECKRLLEMILLPETPPYIDPYASITSSYIPIMYVPCGVLEAYLASNWNAYQLQYAPSKYDLQVLVKDQMGGSVQIESNSCASSISAIPDEGYYFVQWSDSTTNNPRTITLTQDTSLTAIFAKQTFTITFVDDNDTILSSQEVEYNTMPIPPVDPLKIGDAQYSYTFAGWSPAIVAATADATYKATYSRTTNQYTITFLNDDNSVLSSNLWDYGSSPTCEQPIKEDDEEYTYTFNGWNPEVVPVVADATYTATYEATPKSEGIEDVFFNEKPHKVLEKGNIYILMPGGRKYSIIGELIK